MKRETHYDKRSVSKAEPVYAIEEYISHYNIGHIQRNLYLMTLVVKGNTLFPLFRLYFSLYSVIIYLNLYLNKTKQSESEIKNASNKNEAN